MLSVRERMEEHRKNPACTSCHRVIDPLGLALENFDVTGAWRIKDNGVPVDAVGDLYDGTKMDGPAGLRAGAARSTRTRSCCSFTENLMTYALGRRVEYFDMPAVRAIIRDAAQERQPLLGVRPGRRQEPAFQMSERRSQPSTDRRRRAEAVEFQPHGRGDATCSSRRSTCPAAPCCRAWASPWRCRCSRRWCRRGTALRARRAAAKKLRLVAIEMVHGAAGSTADRRCRRTCGRRRRPAATSTWRRAA